MRHLHAKKTSGEYCQRQTNNEWASFVVVADKIDWKWLCMIPSSSLDPNLLYTGGAVPSVFYSQSTPNRPVTPPSNVSIPTSTLISNKTSGNHSYASETHDRDSCNYRLAKETSGSFLGTMPPQQFLERFLRISWGTPQCSNWKGAFASVLSMNKEVDMYIPFISRMLCFCTHCASPIFHR
jgi:hypothetical protein